MGKAIGLLVVAVTGLGVVSVMPWDSIMDRREPSAKLEILSDPSARDASPTVTSDGWRALAREPTPHADNPPHQRVAAPAPAPVVVTIAPRASEPSARAPATTQIANDRFALTRELQRELKRVGCYDGEISGIWTPSTRGAMKAFTGRVNAALPVEEPDLILLTLVRGHEDKVCGMACPGGQGLAADGRCVPNAILAQSARKTPQRAAAIEPTKVAAPVPLPTPIITGWSTTTNPVPPTLGAPPTEGRMALAGPAEAALAAAPLPPVVATTPRPVPLRQQPRFGTSFLKEIDRMGHN